MRTLLIISICFLTITFSYSNTNEKYEKILDLLNGTELFDDYQDQRDMVVDMARDIKSLMNNGDIQRCEYLEFQSLYFDVSNRYENIFRDLSEDLSNYRNMKTFFEEPDSFTDKYKRKFDRVDNFINENIFTKYSELSGQNMGFGLIKKLGRLVINLIDTFNDSSKLLKEIQSEILFHFIDKNNGFPSWYNLN